MPKGKAGRTAIQRKADRRPSANWFESIAARHKAILIAIVAVSILVRIIYFAQLNRGPGIWQHRWQASDMYFFDQWARDIANGDWLTNKALHPYTPWHKQVAESYLVVHPEAATSLAAESGRPPEDAPRALWNRWYGGKTFHQEPLYAYLVAITYKVFGADVRWVFAWQMLFGVLGNVLIYLIARRHFGDQAGLVAGMLAVLCGPLVYYELLLLRTTLATVSGLAIIYLADRALEQGSRLRWLAIGVVTGLSLLLNTPSGFIGLAVLGLLVYRQRHDRRRLLHNAAAMVAGIGLCLAPVVARNLKVGAPALSFSAVGPLAFLSANAGDYSPEEGFLLSNHIPGIISRTKGRFLPVVIETLRTHEDIWSYLRQAWGKFDGAWHWYEKPNNENFYQFRLFAPVLSYLPVTFLLIAPLGMAGLVLAARNRSRHATLLLLVLCTLAPLVIFYVLSRLRLPFVAALIPFAAFTVVRAVEWVRAGDVARSLALFGALGAISLWTMRPLPERFTLIRTDDYMVPYVAYYDIQEKQARDAGDWRRAAEILKDSLKFEPEIVVVAAESRPLSRRADGRLLNYFSKVHRRYAEALRKAGEPAGAAEQEKRAVALAKASGRGG